MNFPVSTLKIFRWLLVRRLFYELFHIDGKSVLKNGFRTKKPAIFALSAATRYFGELPNAINVKACWIWTNKMERRAWKMQEAVLSVAENQFAEIPTELWKQHVKQTAKEIPKVLGFMTEDHHRVRYFVVRELPQIGKPIPPGLIAEELDLPFSKTTEILDELEKNLFFLVRNEKGEVLWAFPVTADQTPHRLTFSTGENINAA
jgi:hypothetical protein